MSRHGLVDAIISCVLYAASHKGAEKRQYRLILCLGRSGDKYTVFVAYVIFSLAQTCVPTGILPTIKPTVRVWFQ